MEEYNDPGALAEFEDQVKRKEHNKQYHRYRCRVKLKAGANVSLQQADKAALHTASRALHMKQGFRRTRKHVVLQKRNNAHHSKLVTRKYAPSAFFKSKPESQPLDTPCPGSRNCMFCSHSIIREAGDAGLSLIFTDTCL